MTVIFKKKPAQRIMGNTTTRTGPMPVSECDLKDNFHDDHRTRTKAGIAQARARGISWGQHGKVLARKNQQEAKAFAENLRPLLLEMGCKIFRGATTVARELNGPGVATPRGGR